MRARALSLVLAVCGSAAGCFDDRGVVLEIDTSAAPGTDQVELFLTSDQCTTDASCRTIKFDGMPRLTGDVWTRLSTSRIVAVVDGHKATFRLETSKDKQLSMLIAVGTAGGVTTGTQTLRDLVVPANQGKVLTTSLIATGELTSTDTGDGARVWVNGESSCFAIAHTDNGEVSRTLVVPPDDYDCDGTPNENDCVPNLYDKGNSTSVGADTNAPEKTCATEKNQVGCVVGTYGCSDDYQGADANTSCRPRADQACLPDGVCSMCKTTFEDCLMDWDKLPRIQCQVPLHDAVALPHDAKVDLKIPFSQTVCRNASIKLVDHGPTTFSDKVQIDDAEIGVSLDDNCEVNLTWSGDLATPGARLGLIRLETADGVALLPLDLDFSLIPPNCNKGGPEAPFCCDPESGIDNNMALWNCVQQPPPDPAQ